jgi:DNA-binding protein HU-beta
MSVLAVPITTQLAPCNLARFLARNIAQQRKCLTLTPKPSLIDEVPLHGGGRRVNKSDLIDAISTTTSMTKRETGNAVNAFVSAIVSEGRDGRRVSVVGFGTFNPTQRGVRMGHGPQTSSTFTDVVHGTTSLSHVKTPAVTRSVATAAKPVTDKALKKTGEKSTKKVVRRSPARTTACGPVGTVVRRAPATQATKRAPASKATKRSANKAVRRASATRPAKHAPARKAAKLSAKKAVRRA